MTLFDIIGVLILGVSAVVGLTRGATREVTNVASLLLAIFVSVFALRFTGPIAVKTVHPIWAANTVAVLIVFVAAYILFRVIGGAMTRGVRQARALGTLDRMIGAGFGLLRGLVLLGVIGLLLNLIMSPDHTPGWIANAKLYPVSRASATALIALAPRGSAFASHLKDEVDQAHEAEDQAQSTGPAVEQSSDSGYSAAARKGLDDAVEKLH